jgi:hypothetical protein
LHFFLSHITLPQAASLTAVAIDISPRVERKHIHAHSLVYYYSFLLNLTRLLHSLVSPSTFPLAWGASTEGVGFGADAAGGDGSFIHGVNDVDDVHNVDDDDDGYGTFDEDYMTSVTMKTTTAASWNAATRPRRHLCGFACASACSLSYVVITGQ